jgi:hypothetical protein
MTSSVRKATIGALAALTLSGGVAMTATPVLAQGPHGGWHGGGWHGGGWRGGYWRGARWYSGGWGAPVAAGVLGGLALGALAGSAYAYGPYCYWQTRPTYDLWGNFAGYQPVQVCY